MVKKGGAGIIRPTVKTATAKYKRDETYVNPDHDYGSGCSSPAERKTEKYKAQIIQTELDFAKMADKKGVAAAFYKYAADSAVIAAEGRSSREGTLSGSIMKNLKPGTRLQWAPDFADVSGDIGYTWGNYTHSVPDSTGKYQSNGVFHTVWKRQPDGSWRFVWD